MPIETDKIDTVTSPADVTNAVSSIIPNVGELNTMIQDGVYYVLKGGLIIFLIVYLIISILIIKQTNLMANTIKTPDNKYIKAVAFVHLIAVFICFVYAILFI